MITVTRIVPRHSGKCNGGVDAKEFYLTADHELYIKGTCERCKQQVDLLIPLADLEANCPISAEFTILDRARLHGLGVRLPDDLQLS